MAEVWLTEDRPDGDDRVAVDAVREVTGWGLADAVRAVRGAPTALCVQVDAVVAAAQAAALRAAGLAAEVREDAGSFALDPASDLARLGAADPELEPLLDQLLAVERRVRPRPSLRDEAAGSLAVALVRAYRAGPEARRDVVHHALAVCPNVRWYVEGQLGRATRELRGGGGPEWVASGLWAAATADGGLDWRDTVLGVEDLLAAAAERGFATEPVLQDALGYGSATLAQLVGTRWLRSGDEG